jgi:hypothetical protein
MNVIRYYVVHATIVILYMTALLPLIMLSDYLGKQAGLHLAVLAVKTVIGLWLVVSVWMSHQTSKRILFEDMTLTKATVASLDEAWPYLAFLPVVGRLFRARGKDGDTDDGADLGDRDSFLR